MLDNRLTALTAQITKMTPQQRQQFAMMHKNDPIILGLTKFINDEDTSFKQAVAAKNAPAVLAPKPTVADQTIAGMAGLPAPNLEGMQPGGIAPGENSQPPQPMPQMQPPMPQQPQGYASGGVTGSWGDDPGSISDALAAGDTYGWSDTPPVAKPRVSPPVVAATQVPVPGVGYSRPGLLANQPPAQQPPQNDFDAQLQKLMQSGGGGGGGGSAAGLTGLLPSAQFNAQLPDVSKLYSGFMGAQPQAPVNQAQIEATNKARTDAANARAAEVEKNIADRGVAGQGYEDYLNQKSAKLDAEEKQNTGLAILDAGLAMMSGESPFALVNIGKGAQVGTKEFREGQQKIMDARDKVAEGLFALDRLRRGETIENQKELLGAHDQARQSVVQGMEDLTKAVAEQYKVNNETAGKMLQGYTTMAGHAISGQAQVQAAGITGTAHILGSRAIAGAQTQAARMQLGLMGLEMKNRMGMQNAAMHAATLAQQELKNNPTLLPGSPEYQLAYNQAVQKYMQMFPGLANSGVMQAPAATPPVTGFRVLR